MLFSAHPNIHYRTDYLTMLKSQEQDIIALKPELGWK